MLGDWLASDCVLSQPVPLLARVRLRRQLVEPAAGDVLLLLGRCHGRRSKLAFKAAMISARSFASLTPRNVLLVPGRNLLGDSKNLSRSSSLQTPPAFFSAGE